ncbi:MAG: AraC family transcriptional regulator [Halioglobus sp.]
MTLSAIQRPDISIHFPQVIIARAVALGVDEQALLDAVRLSPALLADERTRITASQLGALIRLTWHELDDELMGFGAVPHRFGMFALMARQMVESATLGDALRYSMRFYNLTSPAMRWSLQRDDQTRFALTLTDPSKDVAFFIEELMLLIWHRFCNWLIGERVPLLATQFRFEQPSHSGEYRIMFPGPVAYGYDSSAIVFDTRWLQAPVVRSGGELRQYLQRLPDEWFIKQDFEHSLRDRVLHALSEATEFPDLQSLAKNWNLSGRTLHRRLQREGCSFRGLLEQVRRERAISLLLEGQSQVGEIALQLGMTEPAFSRAFKLWTGMTPLAYRRARNKPAYTSI